MIANTVADTIRTDSTNMKNTGNGCKNIDTRSNEMD